MNIVSKIGQVRQRKERRKVCFLMMGLAAVATLATSCSLQRGVPALVSTIPTQQLASDATAGSIFSGDIGPIDNMNSGLTLQRINVVAVPGFPTPTPKDISLVVLNHASEAIQFDNVGFGIQVFEFDAATKKWNRIKLPYTPEPKAKVIPAKLEDYDFSVLNGWDLSADDLAGVTSNQIRIFVTGHGVSTGKRYGAFLDITLQSSPTHGSMVTAI